MKHVLGGLVVAAALIFGSHAFGQTAPPQPLPSSVLCDTCEKAVAVTSSSLATINPSVSPPYNTLTIYNAGSKDAYIKQGDATAVATVSNVRVPSGGAVQVWVSGTYVAAITAGSDTTTLYEYQSNGPIELRVPANASGGGGTAVTIADGADVAEGSKADAAATDSTSSWSVTALLKGAWAKLNALASATSTNVTQLASTPVSAVLQSAVTGNGNGSTLNVSGMASAVLTVNCATCSGGTTINFEGTEDGTNYFALSATQLGTSTIATTTTTSGLTAWQLPVAGLVLVRTRVSAYSAGTITATGHTVPVDWNSRVSNSNVINTPAVTCAACATSANQPSQAAQGSTTSGQTGTLGMMATTTSPPTDTNAQTNALRGDTHGGLRTTPQDTNGTPANFTTPTLTILTSQYPNGATPITGNAAGTTGSVVGTLSGTSGKTTYICGFDVSALGGTAAVGPITVAGLIGSSMIYQFSSLAAGNTLQKNFPVCVPASAQNTSITITTTADGTASAVDVNSWGYQL